MAIATANVKASIKSCFQKFSKNTIGIKTIIKRISNLLILSIPF